jgi:hypothetical protein
MLCFRRLGHLLDKDQIHSNLFNGAGTTYKPLPWNKMERERHHKVRSHKQVFLTFSIS